MAPRNQNKDELQSLNMLPEHGEIKSRLADYIKAVRPWSLTASLIPVIIGACLAYKSHGIFNIFMLMTTIIIVLCVHIAGNLVNTYTDYVKGADIKKSDDLTLVDKHLLPRSIVTMATVFYVVAFSGFLLIVNPTLVKFIIFLLGVSSSYLYSGGLGLKYIALGDALIILIFGPVVASFSYLCHTDHLSIAPVIYSIPQALNVEAILHSNNVRDIDSDCRAGIITLAILLGRSGSYWLFIFLLFSPFLLYLIYSFLYCPLFFLPSISVIFAFQLEKDFRIGNLKLMPQKVAKLNLVMGVLYIIAIFLAQPTLLPYL